MLVAPYFFLSFMKPSDSREMLFLQAIRGTRNMASPTLNATFLARLAFFSQQPKKT